MDSSIGVFLIGMFASVAVDLVRVWRFYERNHRWPAEYKKWGYYLVRGLLALAAGVLPVIYQVENNVLALHIGASAPLIIEQFARTPPDLVPPR